MCVWSLKEEGGVAAVRIWVFFGWRLVLVYMCVREVVSGERGEEEEEDEVSILWVVGEGEGEKGEVSAAVMVVMEEEEEKEEEEESGRCRFVCMCVCVYVYVSSHARFTYSNIHTQTHTHTYRRMVYNLSPVGTLNTLMTVPCSEAVAKRDPSRQKLIAARLCVCVCVLLARRLTAS
jgi:hypothetical protein